MTIYTGVKLGQAICEMLGIDSYNVYHLDLSCGIGDVARVTVYQYPTPSEKGLEQFADIIKHYEIREIE